MIAGGNIGRTLYSSCRWLTRCSFSCWTFYWYRVTLIESRLVGFNVGFLAEKDIVTSSAGLGVVCRWQCVIVDERDDIRGVTLGSEGDVCGCEERW